ncbi:MAG: heme ABC exporter ATP-binding protein CcmA [Bacillota bacterium]
MQLVFESVGHAYGERAVLSCLNWTATAGAVSVITGPNGSGKTTLLKIASGLLRPASGRVRLVVGNRTLEHGAVRREVGYVAPELGLYDRLTALENLAFLAAVRGQRQSRDQLVLQLQCFQLGGSIHQPAGALSSGMRQRLKLASALLHKPPVLVLDEPTSNLDDEGKVLVRKVVREQAERGIVLFATNEPLEVTEYGPQVLRLHPAGAGAGP